MIRGLATWTPPKKDYAAIYFDRAYGEMHVFPQGEKWMLKYHDLTLEMKPKAEDVFTLDLPVWGMTLAYEFTFHRKDNRITHLSVPLETAVGTTNFRRVTESE